MDESYSKLVDIAYNMHISGKVEEAKEKYEELLKINPDDINVQNLYAQLNVSIKNFDIALQFFNNIYEKTKLDDVKLNIAKVYFYKCEYENAIIQISSIKNKNISVLKLLALSYIKLNKFQNAINVYNSFIDNENMRFADFFNLSVSYMNLSDINNALKYALIAHSLNNNDIDINIHIASLYKQTDEEIKAIDYYIKVLEFLPDDKNILLSIAIIYKNHDKFKSIEILEHLKNIYPDDVSLKNYLYIMYRYVGKNEEAYKLSLEIIKQDENNYYGYLIAGDSLYDLYKYIESEKMYRKALNLNAENKTYIIKQIAYIMSLTNRKNESLTLLKEYLYDKDCKSTYGFIHWKNKNLKETREIYYNWLNELDSKEKHLDRAKQVFYMQNIGKRYNITENAFFQNNKVSNKEYEFEQYKLKQWKNEDITRKRLFLYSANGVGDLIMFSRYIYRLKEIVSKLIIKIPSSCLSLFKNTFPDIQIVTDDINSNEYDYSTSFMKLLYNLNIDLNDIEFSSKYLFVDKELIQEKSKIEEININKKKLGIFWQGNPTILANRSISIEYFTSLFTLNSYQLYSFQISKIDYKSEELKKKLPIVNLAPYISNYSDTAALLHNMDLLITIDSSIANLAGALGIKTYLLLPYDSEWRWFNDTESTPWYDSVRIFKQRIPNDWAEVIQRVKHELTL